MNDQVIHSETELLEALRNVFDKSPFRIAIHQAALTAHGTDLTVHVEYEGHSATFAAECKLNPTSQALGQVLALTSGKQLPLLVAVKLSESLVEQCRQRGISCLDLNGRIWIKAPGLLIDRTIPASQIRYRLAEPEIQFFSTKSTRLPRALLSYPNRTWRQRDLAELTGLSQGLLSRLLNHAAGQGWVTGRRGDWELARLDLLLDAWVRADVWPKRVTRHQYSTISNDFPGLARGLVEKTVGDIAFTQWFAADLRFPYTQPPLLSVYRREFLNAEEKEFLHLREVADGGKLWVLVPKDPGVFQTIRRIDGFPIVCDVQIYLDLLQVGLRGPDQAKALREWEGFCTS
ncbi:MAG: hypothetical protein KA248_10715 [Kiritimatiellae bacterium]|nr:hypothetical protein [Kiritimatiellia bacterium]